MAKVCPTCGGRGKADLYQLSDYFDPCPTCNGSGEVSEAKPFLTKGQLTRIRLGIGTAWTWTKIVLGWLIFAGFVLAMFLALGMPGAVKKRSCESGGGAYVMGGLFTADECWAEDGTRRLFPKGWK